MSAKARLFRSQIAFIYQFLFIKNYDTQSLVIVHLYIEKIYRFAEIRTNN